MLSGHRSVRRRPGRNNRPARIAVPVVAVMALALAVGIVVASGRGPAKLRSAASSSQTAGVSSSAVNPNCAIIVPANPLTAKGLATPYQLTGPAGTSPALAQGRCTDGEPGSPFGQVSFCNGTAFFDAAFKMERAGRLIVPSAGTSRRMVATAAGMGTGRECPTTRNFDMVDQDPSDNVTTRYLFNPVTGQTAQDDAANAARMKGDPLLVNGSDNALIDDFLDPALGCTPFEAPDLGNNGALTTSQALDELLAAANQPRNAALVPENDEMVLDNGGAFDQVKTDLYRSEIGQAPVDARTDASSSPAMFCQDMVDIQTPFLAANQQLLAAWPSPVPTVGDTLFTFMANRLASSFDTLGCQNYGLAQPVSVVVDGSGAATQATLNTDQQTGF